DKELVVVPFGREAALKAAGDLAKNVITRLGDSPPDTWAVGIENGIEEFDEDGRTSYFDHAVIVFLHTDGSCYYGVSEPVSLPVEAVMESNDRGVPVGVVLAEQTGCSPDDPHSFLTNGKMPRKRLIKDALV